MKRFMLLICAVLVALTVACGAESNLKKSEYSDANVLTDISMVVKEGTVERKVETVTLIITNLSSKTYMYGAPYELEVARNGEWYTYPPKEDLSWILIVYMFESDGTSEETITLYSYYGELKPGTYRIVKSFSTEDSENGVAYALFEVE